MTVTLSFDALPGSRDGAWESLAWLPSAEWLVTQSAKACQGTLPEGLSACFEGMGIPALDLLVTPMSARIGALAAAKGTAFFHHELRGRLPVPEALAPERHVWEGPLVPVWEEGVLTEPKYFSFFLDTPFAPYNPNYRRKWRAHELLHGLVGFYWHPEMTRFGCYLGARLDELLPIIHWYGLDEVFRPRCEEHIGVPFARELCPVCESMAIPYTDLSSGELERLREPSLLWVERAWAHLREEWEACVQEWETGRTVRTRRGHLDASSDATGYLMSHWPRLTAWSFGSWVEMFLQDGIDYYSEHDLMMKVMNRTLARVVSGSISISQEQLVQRRMKRVVQDIGYRVLLALEWLDEESAQAERAEAALMPLLEQGGMLARDLETLVAQGEDWCASLFSAFADVSASCKELPAILKTNFPMLGYQWQLDLAANRTISYPAKRTNDGLDAASAQALVEEGLSSVAPSTQERLPNGVWPRVGDWMVSPSFREEGRLVTRYCRWCLAQPEWQGADRPLWLEWLLFESWLADEPRHDEEAMQFATIPEPVTALSWKSGSLRIHRTFRQLDCPARVAQEVLGVQVDEPTAPLAAVFHGRDPSIVWMEPEMLDVIRFVNEDVPVKEWMTSRYAQVCELLFEHAFLVWLPAPKM